MGRIGERTIQILVLQVQDLPVDFRERLQEHPEPVVTSAHLQSPGNDVLSNIESDRFPFLLGRQAIAGHGRRLGDCPDKEAIEYRGNILPKTGLRCFRMSLRVIWPPFFFI